MLRSSRESSAARADAAGRDAAAEVSGRGSGELGRGVRGQAEGHRRIVRDPGGCGGSILSGRRRLAARHPAMCATLAVTATSLGFVLRGNELAIAARHETRRQSRRAHASQEAGDDQMPENVEHHVHIAPIKYTLCELAGLAEFPKGKIRAICRQNHASSQSSGAATIITRSNGRLERPSHSILSQVFLEKRDS